MTTGSEFCDEGMALAGIGAHSVQPLAACGHRDNVSGHSFVMSRGIRCAYQFETVGAALAAATGAGNPKFFPL